MATDKITARTIQAYRNAARASGKPLFLMDTARKGFGCYIGATGNVSFIMQHWAGGRGGKPTRVAIGKHPPMTLEQAIKVYDEAKGAVAKGEEFGTAKREQKARIKATIEAGTLEDAFEAYKRKNFKPGRHWDEILRIFSRNVLPKLGPKTLIRSIDKADIRQLVDAREEEAPGAARNMFALMRHFFAWTAERDLITSSPMIGLKPPSVAKKRERVLSDKEIKAVWQGCDALGWPFGPLYKLLLLTAQRRDEVSGMRWAELDLNEATWTIPKDRTKNNKEHVVHLSAQSLGIIRALPRIEGSELVFTTTGRTAISGYSRAKRNLDALAGEALGKALEPWRVHDLRRTAASGMARLKVPPHIIERVLNHISGVQGGLVGVYQRYEYEDERRDALKAWSNAVEAIVSNQASNVVALRQIAKV